MKFFHNSRPSPRTLTTSSATVAVSAGATTASTSANGPNRTYSSSGFAFVDNSQGSAAAVRELAAELDIGLGLEDGEGETISDLLELQLSRLNKTASGFINCGLNGIGDEWNCDWAEAELIDAAWTCAARVYNPDTTEPASRLNVKREVYLQAAQSGTAKATEISLVTPAASGDQAELSSPCLPAILVAVRGTASTVDCMVNLNGRPNNILPLISGQPLVPAVSEQLVTLKAHSGFLNAALTLAPTISNHIASILLANPGVKHIVYTGHSAGGAVSSLMFLRHFLGAKNDPNIKVSSITFGAPPSLSTDITSLLQLPSLNRTRSLIIDFVNEFDVVSRVDRNYLLSLVDLYRSIYDLPPVERTGDEWSDVAKAKEENEKPILPRFSFDDKDMDKMDVWKGRGKLWSLPRSEYVGLGEAVVLGVRVIEKEERVKKLDKELEGNFEKTSGNASESEDEDELALTAVKVRKEQFSKLLFCNVNVHRRTAYRERMGMIMEGRFNGKAGRT